MNSNETSERKNKSLLILVILLLTLLIVVIVGISKLLYSPFKKTNKVAVKALGVCAITWMWIVALFIFMDIGLADDPKALDGLILKYKLNTSAYVSVEKANFRSAPNGKITRQLTRGTTVMPIEKVDNSWWKVQLQDGTIGFLHKTVFKTEVSKVVTNKVMAILLLIAPYAVALLVLIRDISKRRQASVSPSPDHINHRIYDTL